MEAIDDVTNCAHHRLKQNPLLELNDADPLVGSAGRFVLEGLKEGCLPSATPADDDPRIFPDRPEKPGLGVEQRLGDFSIGNVLGFCRAEREIGVDIDL